jgi:hypothetical protein
MISAGVVTVLKLNAGFSRKVGEPDFGSRGASVNVELELDSNLIRDSEAFCAQIRNLFDLARQSVDEELAVDRTHPADSHSRRSTGPGNGSRENGSAENRSGANGNSVRHATSSQLRAIRAICERLNRDPEQFASQRFRVNRIEELTLQEASSLIDELKSTAGNGQQRGGTR